MIWREMQTGEGGFGVIVSTRKFCNFITEIQRTPMIPYKQFIIFFILLSFFGQLHAQNNDMERYMTRRQLACEDIMYNCSFLIPEFYE